MTSNRKGKSFYEAKQQESLNEKIAVSLLANSFLSEGDSIIIDAGTSLTPLSNVILQHASSSPDETHYSIMTHNREAFDTLIQAPPETKFNVFQTGGRYDDDLKASFGWLAEYAYQNFHAKWVFLGQAGIVAHQGLFCHGNTEELSLKRIIFSKPGYARVIISDSNKLGIPAGLCFGESDKFVDNVDHCILLTTVPNEMKALEKFDRELTILESTYKVKIVRVEYEYDEKSEILKLVKLTELNKSISYFTNKKIVEASLKIKREKKGKFLLSNIIIKTDRAEQGVAA